MQSARRFLSVVTTLLLSSLLSAVNTVAQTGQITIELSTTSVSLAAGQSAKLAALVRGTNVPGLTWSLMPQVGSFTVSGVSSTLDGSSPTPVGNVTGVYTAPSNISSPQAVTLLARSIADPTKTASATIYLASTVGIALAPSSASLTANQSASFNASIGGTLNTSVTWSLQPAVGTITNGVYTAPAIISTLQTVILTAASLADPSKTAQASITLQPSLPTSISVNPGQTTVQASASQQFTATIQGGAAGVVWSISPRVGSITPSGLYTAPSSFTDQQTVLITAAISTDPTKHASGLVTLTGATPPPPVPPVQLPVEVVGLDGTVITVPFNISAASNLSGAPTLSMRIHGLRYETQASVQVNGGGWQPINSSNVTLIGYASAYGGIGGGFSTLKMGMQTAAGVLTTGTNMISFRFNGTDGRVSGFRVLNFNFLDANGNRLLPEAAFVYEDPNTWQPPSSQPSDIAAGKTLWSTAPLTRPTPGGPVPIQARCADCHAQDGRDLKYFNYSNNSIRTRSTFHGLTAQQGDQIASYIRSLNVVNPGRPWNPPYQPGPGLDSQPVSNWSAGAGIDAVLDHDVDMLNYLAPGGNTTSWAPTSNISVREMPIAFQLPDWNSWLPGIHPKDAWGAQFTNSDANAAYLRLRANLVPGNGTVYAANVTDLDYVGHVAFLLNDLPPVVTPVWTAAYTDAAYSTREWQAVKHWELNQEFQLEGLGQAIHGPQAEQRSWVYGNIFRVSPNLIAIPPGSPGLRNGKVATWYYLAFAWYHLQLVLNFSNYQTGGRPIDWPYAIGMINELGAYASAPQASLLMLWLVKALQIMEHDGGPELGTIGWAPNVNNFVYLAYPDFNRLWPEDTSAQRAALSQAYVQQWFGKVQQFTPQQFYQGNWATATEIPDGNYNADFANWLFFAIPQMKFFGVDPILMNQIGNWAKTVWTAANWDSAINATCSWNAGRGLVLCSNTIY